jgi:predicted RND superfamily exporter protein
LHIPTNRFISSAAGIPYDYWSQYEDIFAVLIELGLSASAVGFVISWAFLFAKLSFEGRHERRKIFWGSLVGALLITGTILTSLVTVIGLSALADVSLTGFSNMSFVLSVGFAVEYSVHIVARWIRADNSMTSSVERVKHTMSFLMLPTFMSFVSSTIGVVCLAFTDFEFNRVFFFRPLLIVMMVTYFIGCYSLPAFLTYLDFEVCRLGKTSPEASVYFTKSFALRDVDAKESTARATAHDSDDVVDESKTKSASDSSHEQAYKEAPESLEEEEIE